MSADVVVVILAVGPGYDIAFFLLPRPDFLSCLLFVCLATIGGRGFCVSVFIVSFCS